MKNNPSLKISVDSILGIAQSAIQKLQSSFSNEEKVDLPEKKVVANQPIVNLSEMQALVAKRAESVKARNKAQKVAMPVLKVNGEGSQADLKEKFETSSSNLFDKGLEEGWEAILDDGCPYGEEIESLLKMKIPGPNLALEEKVVIDQSVDLEKKFETSSGVEVAFRGQPNEEAVAKLLALVEKF